MPKALCILGMVVSILLMLLFVADIVSGFPFRGIHWAWSGTFIVGAAGLAFLSWSTYRKVA